MSEKLVSVLIPTYNVEKFITQAIESIINQSYKNLEIIIVDDCSNDSTFQILKELEKKDNRIKLFRNEKNLKICQTLNKAFQNSSGEYIVRMDGDDVCEADRIKKQIEYLEQNKEVSLVGMSVKGISEQNKEISKNRYLESFDLLKKQLKYGSPVLHIWAAKRSIYEVLKGYREIPYVEDYDFLLRMITAGYKFSNLEEYYGYYVRFREGNTMTTNGIEQIKAFDYAQNLYKERIKNKNNRDSFSEKKFYEYIKTNKNERIKYTKSAKLFEKYLLTKDNTLVSIIYLLRAIFTSKYQFKRIKDRFLFKFYQIRVKKGEN